MSSVTENLTRREASQRADVIGDEVHYDILLDLTRGDEHFSADVTITFDATAGDPTFLDCTAHEVERVELNGRRLPDNVIHDTRISLPSLAAHNTVRVQATMAYTKEGKGLHFFRDPSDECVYLHSQCEPFDAHLIFPCFDQPDLKATYALTVHAPEDWVVVSNSSATERPAEGDAGMWRFATTPRFSTYLFAVVAGSYSVWESTHGNRRLGLYARRSLEQFVDHEEFFEITRQGLTWFEANYGVEYPFGDYDQLIVPEFSAGAMENPGCITFAETYLFRSKVTDSARERRAEVILHEMAHMWFGDLVTMKWWDDLWLNESFATFMSMLAQTEATRFTNGWVTFLDAEKSWAKQQDQLPSTHPIAADMVDIESVHQNFDGITYAKGASVLRQLVAWVGQEAFLEGCRRYFAKHAWGNAELADFLAALEAASGRELGSWVEAWLQTTGITSLGAETTADEERYTSFSIRQTSPSPEVNLRPHRIAVGLYDLTDAGLVRRVREELDVDGASTDVPAFVGQPIADLVLVNDDDLTYAKVVLDDRSTATVAEHLSRITDPLARALCWSATWDMVRDGGLAASRFIDLVLRNLPAESEIGVLQRILARVLAAAERYGDPERADVQLAKLADHARTQLDAAGPGSDAQLAWARHWASCARRGQQRDDVANVLSGDLVIPGLQVDTDLRWHLVISLAVTNSVDAARIDEELGRDQTDLGERNAATARAARPDVVAKNAAWNRVIDDADLSHTMSRQIMTGFNRIGQTAVLAEYTDRFFADFDRVWTTLSQNRATEWTESMFPHWEATEALVDRVNATVAGDVRAPAKRALLEQRDTLERTIRARVVDADVSAG